MSTPTLGRAGATSTASFPLSRLPASAARGGWRVQTTLETLTMAKGTDKVRGGEAEVHEIAEAASVAFAVLVLTAACFPEVGHGGQLRIQWATCEHVSVLPWCLREVNVTYPHTSDRLSYQRPLGPQSPTRSARRRFQSDGPPHCRIPSARMTVNTEQTVQKVYEDSHGAPRGAQTSLAHSKGPRTPRQSPPAAPSRSCCILGRARGYGRRWVGGSSVKRQA